MADRERRTAWDLSSREWPLEKERRRLAGADTANQRLQRELIFALLSDKLTSKNAPSPFSLSATKIDITACHTYRHDKSASKVSIMYPLITTNAFVSKYKSFGCLEQGEGYPPILALSGWASKTSDIVEFLDNRLASDHVLELAEQLEVDLPKGGRDGGVLGRGKACHVEMQLMVAFIRRHRFELADSSSTATMMKHLKDTCSPCTQLLSAKILMDNHACENCLAWKRLLEDEFNVRFEFQTIRRGLGDAEGRVVPSPLTNKVRRRQKRRSQSQSPPLLTSSRSNRSSRNTRSRTLASLPSDDDPLQAAVAGAVAGAAPRTPPPLRSATRSDLERRAQKKEKPARSKAQQKKTRARRVAARPSTRIPMRQSQSHRGILRARAKHRSLAMKKAATTCLLRRLAARQHVIVDGADSSSGMIQGFYPRVLGLMQG